MLSALFEYAVCPTYCRERVDACDEIVRKKKTIRRTGAERRTRDVTRNNFCRPYVNKTDVNELSRIDSSTQSDSEGARMCKVVVEPGRTYARAPLVSMIFNND